MRLIFRKKFTSSSESTRTKHRGKGWAAGREVLRSAEPSGEKKKLLRK